MQSVCKQKLPDFIKYQSQTTLSTKRVELKKKQQSLTINQELEKKTFAFELSKVAIKGVI